MKIVRMEQLLFCILSLWLASPARASIPATPAKALYDLTYKVEVPKPKDGASFVKVWIPMPADSPEQKIITKQISTTVGYEINTERRFGSRMIYLELGPRTRFPVKITATYRIERSSPTKSAESIVFSTGRELILEPHQRGNPVKSFVSPYVEINGKPSKSYRRDVSVRPLSS